MKHYTATTIQDGTRHRGQVWRANGSVAWEGPKRYHKTQALADAQKIALSLSR